MSLILTAGMDGEPEPVAGSAFVESGQATPKRYSERERLTIERRAAFFGRTYQEEVAYTDAVLAGQRLPDPNDLEMIQRVRTMQGKGQLPSQRRAKAVTHLASIDRLPDGVDVVSPTTVKEVCDIYLEYKLKGRPSYACVRRTVRHTMELNGFADVKLSDLTPGVIKRWHASMASRHVTGNNGLKTLRSALRFCRSLELLQDDPTAGIKRFREDSRDRYVTPSEMPRLMEALKHALVRPRAFFMITLFTASRPGEVSAMRWEDLDFAGRCWRKPTSKTGRSQYIELIPAVYRLLRQVPQVSDYVFPGNDLSSPWNESTMRKAWNKIRTDAKLPDVIAYDLRRTMGSWMAQHGINLSTIQASLNHSTLQATHRYARMDVRTAGRALEGITKHMTGSADPFFNGLCAPLTPEELSPEAQELGENSGQLQVPDSAPPSADSADTTDSEKDPSDMDFPG